MSKKNVGLVQLCKKCGSVAKVCDRILSCNNKESDHYAHVFFDEHPACEKFMVQILTEVKKNG